MLSLARCCAGLRNALAASSLPFSRLSVAPLSPLVTVQHTAPSSLSFVSSRAFHVAAPLRAKLELEPTEGAEQKAEAGGSVSASYKGPVHLAHIHSTMNNTTITITDLKGDTVHWASCGSSGFSGARRSSPYAAQETGQAAAKGARGKGVEVVRVLMKGLGRGRLNAVKGLQAGGLSIQSISDVTPVPHNGARPKKARRL